VWWGCAGVCVEGVRDMCGVCGGEGVQVRGVCACLCQAAIGGRWWCAGEEAQCEQKACRERSRQVQWQTATDNSSLAEKAQGNGVVPRARE